MKIITEFTKKDIGLNEFEFGGTKFFAATCQGLVVTDFSHKEQEVLEEATSILEDVLGSRIVGLVGFEDEADLKGDTIVCSSQILESKEGSHLIVFTMDGEFEELMCFEDDLITTDDVKVGMTITSVLAMIQNKMEGGASASA